MNIPFFNSIFVIIWDLMNMIFIVYVLICFKAIRTLTKVTHSLSLKSPIELHISKLFYICPRSNFQRPERLGSRLVAETKKCLGSNIFVLFIFLIDVYTKISVDVGKIQCSSWIWNASIEQSMECGEEWLKTWKLQWQRLFSSW